MTPTRVLPARALSAFAALALSLGGALLVTAGPASADTTTVTNTADDGTSTSLRGVLESASDGDIVVLTAGAPYLLTICYPPAPSAAEGSAGWGDVEITGSVTIVGNGATIEQTCEDRVLYTQDAITLENVTITGGLTKDPGGGLFQDSSNPTTLTGVTFTGNTAGAGGGLATGGDVTATGCTFTDNHALEEHGGGIRVFSEDATAIIDGSTLSGNTADGWGGAFEQQGRSEDTGATAEGVFTLTVTNSVVSGNTADSDGGGGLDTEDPATITIDHSTISGNNGEGGGGVGAYGETTTFTANASTFSGNVTEGSGSAVFLSGVEEVEPVAAAAEETTATFTNSTITGNTEGAFGAVAVHGALTFNHVTMTNNTSEGVDPETDAASSRGNVDAFAVEGDAANVAAHTFTSANSVVSQPHGAVNCTELDAPATDGGYNFSDDESCGFTAPTSNVKTPNDPVLGPLANNGGPTQTLLPLAGSPLLDVIPPAACGATVDQRGVTRPQGTACDIGAVEQ
jgi:hypothetical protein